MNKTFYMLFFAIIALSAIVSAQELPEGYVQEPGEDYSVTYNPFHIIELFSYGAADASAMNQQNATDGLLPIFFRGKEIGFLYGTIAANPETHKLVITDGGFISSPIGQEAALIMPEEEEVWAFGDETEQVSEEGETMRINVAGKKIVADVSQLPEMVLTAISGVYQQHDYSIACREKCRITASVSPLQVRVNITGPAVIIRSEYLLDYQQGREVDEEWHANILELNDLKFYAGQHINAYASANEGSEFGKIFFASPGQFSVLRQWGGYDDFYDAILPSDGISMRISQGANILVFSPLSEEDSASIILQRSSPSAAGSLSGMFSSSDVSLELEKGRIIFLASEADFRRCFSGLHACIIADRENIKIKPEESEDGLLLTVIYPALARLQNPEMLELSKFEDEQSSITLAREDMPAKVIFSKGDIIVENGNWFDLGVSFSAYVYDSEIFAYDKIECNAILKQCYLNGVQVSGLEQLHPSRCRADSECGEGMVCGCEDEKFRGRCPSLGHCMRSMNCYELSELNPEQKPENPINVLVIGDDYPNRGVFIDDAKKAIDIGGVNYGIFSVSPFKDYKDRFVFYTMPLDIEAPEFARELGDELMPSGRYINYFKRQCPIMDQAIILSRERFRDFAYFDGIAYLSIPLKPYTSPHEFGHSFGGLADEYYNFVEGVAGNQGVPNCLETRDSAISTWAGILNSREKAKQLADQAELWNQMGDSKEKGCGGDCDERCGSYYRPRHNSIMKTQGRPEEGIVDGDTFNDVSTIWLENKLRQI
ncbi:MAG: M64 family metallopeptidase [Nanoarchaeota archaeon]|nr:M64 family metallopeptidase [Nanoarchaeota archaeon]